MGGGASHFDDAVPLGTVEIFHTYYTRDNQRISLPSSFLLQRSLCQPD